VTLTLTLCSLPIPESQFSKTLQLKAILQDKDDSGLLYSVTDEIPVSHLLEMEKCWEITLIRQSQVINHYAAGNGFMFLL
jgi:hypothetical protein